MFTADNAKTIKNHGGGGDAKTTTAAATQRRRKDDHGGESGDGRDNHDGSGREGDVMALVS